MEPWSVSLLVTRTASLVEESPENDVDCSDTELHDETHYEIRDPVTRNRVELREGWVGRQRDAELITR